MRDDVYVEVDGKVLRFSRPDKILYPRAKFKKRDVLEYYRAVAPWLVPHLRGRPLTLKRYPDGVSAEYFYQKRCPSHRPRWLRTVRHLDIDFCSIDDLPSLLWVANLASIELHPGLNQPGRFSESSYMVFDLDPGPPAGLLESAWVALRVRAELQAAGLHSCAKTSGSKGLQVYVPLNSGASFAETKAVSRRVAERLESLHPDRIVSKMSKKLRPGKVFIDWSQNDTAKTTVAVYSLRATERPCVSTPMSWSEIERGLRGKKLESFVFSPEHVVGRLKEIGDLFSEMLTLRQVLSLEELQAA